MSPGEAIVVGGGSGAIVVTLGSLFVKRLFTNWLSGIEALPGQISQLKEQVTDDLGEFRDEQEKTLNTFKIERDQLLRDHTDKNDSEIIKLRNDAHDHRETTSTIVGVLSNRVFVVERDVAKQDKRLDDLHADMHRIDSNVIMIAASMNLRPKLPE